MENIDKLATERILKARSELVLARRFYGVLVSNVEPVLSRRFPTMATNGKEHFFNPEYIMKLTPKKVLGVQVHETEHDARHHGTRRGGRDPKKWNEACDYAINPDVIDEGFELPDGVLLDRRFKGMSAEDIYRIRELEEQRDKPQPQPEPEDEPEDEKSEGDDEGEDAQQPNEQQGDEPGSGAGQGEGEDEADGEGESQTCGDPGQCGEVLDSAEDAGDIAEADQKWERIVRQAVSMAKAIGQLPGHVTADIERANNPPQDWREVLRAWVDESNRRIETWNRPNRRFAAQGIVLPSSQKDGVNKIACIIDTSMSMDVQALACVRTELQSALDDHLADELVVVYNDTRVTRVDHFVQGDDLIFDPRGRGGTDLKPAFKYVAEEIGDVSGMLVFTDLEIGDPGPEPACPVMFAVYGYPQKVREYIANAPWGAPGIDVGEH